MHTERNAMATIPDESRRIGANDPIQPFSEIPSRSAKVDAMRRLRRNRAAVLGTVIVALNLLIALFAPSIAPSSYASASFPNSNATPGWVTWIFPAMKPREAGGYVKINDRYPFGADKLGRDLLSRIVYGARISMAIAIVGPLISILIGLIVGLVAGYQGGRTDTLLMRFVDIMYAFPTILLIILLVV